MKVFLGGTCDGYDWRKSIMSELDSLGIEYFNPVVENYTDEDRERENREKNECDLLLFTITDDIAGVYSIAEVVECAIRRGHRVIFCNMYQRHTTDAEIKMGGSLECVEHLLYKHTMHIYHDLHSVVDCIRSIQAVVNCSRQEWLNNLLLQPPQPIEQKLKVGDNFPWLN